MQQLCFDSDQLSFLASELQERYRTNVPFPHIVIDDLLPAEVLDRVVEEFPAPGQMNVQFSNPRELKSAADRFEAFPATIRSVLLQFNAAPFCRFLEQLTGIEGLIPDPYYLGGGMHQIQRGGFLKLHADFNRHGQLKLDRRLNVILYLNRDWEDAYGGHLELWNQDMSRCVQRILPAFNRCVVFNTTEDSYHGHPDPLTCPDGRTRKSLALYYYTAAPAEARVGETHGTMFRERPGEAFKTGWRDYVKAVTPPVVFELGRRLRRQP